MNRLINYPCRLPLIGLAGPARSGKNTTADILCRHWLAVQYAFALPLKAMLQAGFGLNDVDLDGWRKEEPNPLLGGKSPRQLLQTLGTEWGRQLVDPDIWVTQTRRWCQAFHDDDPDAAIILTDVRFQNEADFIRRNGGLIIHLRRTDCQPVSQHRSENGVDYLEGIDFLIHNNGTLDELTSFVLELGEFIAGQTSGGFLRAS